MGNPSCLGVVTFDRAVRCLSNWVTGRSDADITTRDSIPPRRPVDRGGWDLAWLALGGFVDGILLHQILQ